MYAQKEDSLIAWDPSQLLPNVSGALVSSAAVVQATCGTFRGKIKKFLKEVQIDAR